MKQGIFPPFSMRETPFITQAPRKPVSFPPVATLLQTTFPSKSLTEFIVDCGDSLLSLGNSPPLELSGALLIAERYHLELKLMGKTCYCCSYIEASAGAGVLPVAKTFAHSRVAP